jgi:hypothetical protein
MWTGKKRSSANPKKRNDLAGVTIDDVAVNRGKDEILGHPLRIK